MIYILFPTTALYSIHAVYVLQEMRFKGTESRDRIHLFVKKMNSQLEGLHKNLFYTFFYFHGGPLMNKLYISVSPRLRRNHIRDIYRSFLKITIFQVQSSIQFLNVLKYTQIDFKMNMK